MNNKNILKYKNLCNKDNYLKKEEREELLKLMSNEEIDELIKRMSTMQAKIYLAKFKK